MLISQSNHLKVFREIVRSSTCGRGKFPLLFFENWKKCTNFENNMTWLCSSTGSISHLKCYFKIIYDKKFGNFSLRVLSFGCCRWNVYRSALIPKIFVCSEKLLFFARTPLDCCFWLSQCNILYFIINLKLAKKRRKNHISWLVISMTIFAALYELKVP